MTKWTSDLDAWRAYLVASGFPPTTIKIRVYHLERLAREVGGTPASLTFPRLAEWLAARSWQPNTRRAYRSSLRAFYGWAMATGRVGESPAHLLPPVRVPRGRPRPVPEDTYRARLGDAPARVRLAMLLCGGHGLRRGEAAAARTDHLEEDLAGWTLRVVGKGGHVRLVPLLDEVAEMIRAAPEGWLFPSSQGGHLTPHYLGKLVSGHLGTHTTHQLRHRAGTVSYQETRDIRAVQEFLGHAKVDTTMIYTKVADGAVRAAMQACA